MRHKAIHGTLVHPSIKFACDWMLNILSEKLKNRVKIHTNINDIDTIDIKILPKEYGGIIPMKDMIEAFKKELKENREFLLSNDKMNVRFELYPDAVRQGSIKALSIPLDSPDDAFNEKKDSYGMNGMQGSFRKLDFD